MDSKENKENKQVIDITYKSARFSRVLSANFFDLFTVIILFILLLVPTMFILQSDSSYIENKSKRENVLIESKLYIKQEDNILQLSSYLEDNNELTYNEKSSQYDMAYTHFYGTYLNVELEEKGLETYINIKKEYKYESNNLFDENGNRVLSNSDYDVYYYNFYKDMYSSTLSYLKYKADYVDSLNFFKLAYIVSIIVCLSLAYIIIYYIIPLIMHLGHQTLGMRLTKIATIGVDGFSLTFLRFTLRFLFSFIFMFYGSIFGLLIPTIISITMSLKSSRRQSLTDYVLNTYTITCDDEVIFKNITDYMVYLNNNNKTKE